MLAFRAGFNSFRREIAHTLEGLGVAVHQMTCRTSAGRICLIVAFDRFRSRRCPSEILTETDASFGIPDHDSAVIDDRGNATGQARPAT
jgi:hypothetical protein